MNPSETHNPPAGYASGFTPESMLAMFRERSVRASPFTAMLGIELLRCWGGESELLLPVRAELQQHHGTVHGGVLGVVVDNACGWAAASVAGPLVTAHYAVHLLAPARGERLRAVGRLIRAGQRSAVAAADVFAEAQGQAPKLVASGMASFAVLDK
ncbi:PaaI family thioesterase [Aquabacterium sp.]|uniref:PaaI family thioesterase n=1 Tax=Aquabacterium sp. TaxID=1872578 RepID=UPI00378304EC